MYPGAIARAKKKLVAVSNDQDLQMSDDVRDAIESAMTAIYCLEKECERAYSDGKADGLVEMANIIFGSSERE